MVFETASRRGHWAARLRLGILTLVGLLVSHTAIFASQYGIGDQFARAMSAGGHDGWWVAASVVVLVLGALLLLATLGGLGRLERRARALPAVPMGGRGYRTELITLWRRLFPFVAALFALQENLERLATHGDVIGIEALLGPEHPLAMPVLALVCLALAALGALIRWRIRELQTRIAEAVRMACRRVVAAACAAGWRTIGALAPHAWLLDRLDAGRAPPLILPA